MTNRVSGRRIAILGATGLVGQTLLAVLEQRRVPVETLVPLATEGAGRVVTFGNQTLAVESVDTMDWSRVDVCFFAASNEASEKYRPIATQNGVTVIDKASRFRMDHDVPLIVPEVNMAEAKDRLYLASPNCSTIQLVVALEPIRRRWGLSRVIVSTYQAVSGTGRDAIETLRDETQTMMDGQPVTPSTYPFPIAHNTLPFCDRFGEGDFTGEEWKLTRETQKIFSMPLALSATAVRVPVYVGHSEAVYIETEKAVAIEDVRDALREAPSVKVVDDPEHGVVPTPLNAAGSDDVWVGRLRKDPFVANGIHLYVVADNLRKGAATNAVQIMEGLSYRWE